MKYAWFIIISSVWISACAPINTHFSCNETAQDQCLSIEDVNALAERLERGSSSGGLACQQCKKEGHVWHAPKRAHQGRGYLGSESDAHPDKSVVTFGV